MKIKALREFYGDQGEVRAGREIEVTQATGRELVANGLAEIVNEEDEEIIVEDPDEKVTPPAGGGKKADEPKNKKAAEPANKAALSTETK